MLLVDGAASIVTFNVFVAEHPLLPVSIRVTDPEPEVGHEIVTWFVLVAPTIFPPITLQLYVIPATLGVL